MDDDDFFIPTGEELDRGAVPERPRKRGLLGWLSSKRESRNNERPRDPKRRKVDIEVPETVAKGHRSSRHSSSQQDGELLDSGSTGRVVRSIDISADGVAGRELIIPQELRDKYQLDE
ncbi:hypothetical protein SacmaDRAFT_1970 [Saccharomonospora marina XMU15]|uniref:Uncharacterized protein n=1 Tax=Saccharomonospora marina XMU15 TaxID=882083 RepID=H5X8D2_9PSEU|nr:hypothetical protein [Saccharomonospora marina]EHR50228.1 hypothetical protein SacmaDRAFT_1970 [Saccharomonospora marina XMU15]